MGSLLKRWESAIEEILPLLDLIASKRTEPSGTDSPWTSNVTKEEGNKVRNFAIELLKQFTIYEIYQLHSHCAGSSCHLAKYILHEFFMSIDDLYENIEPDAHNKLIYSNKTYHKLCNPIIYYRELMEDILSLDMKEIFRQQTIATMSSFTDSFSYLDNGICGHKGAIGLAGRV